MLNFTILREILTELQRLYFRRHPAQITDSSLTRLLSFLEKLLLPFLSPVASFSSFLDLASSFVIHCIRFGGFSLLHFIVLVLDDYTIRGKCSRLPPECIPEENYQGERFGGDDEEDSKLGQRDVVVLGRRKPGWGVGQQVGWGNSGAAVAREWSSEGGVEGGLREKGGFEWPLRRRVGLINGGSGGIGAMEDDKSTATNSKESNGDKKKADTKTTLLTGLGKAKVALTAGGEKLKNGASMGAKWVKHQCQRKGSTKPNNQ
ncbi:hypothetical protein Ancab_004881 [Ancistrocladus abbreviatus]